VFFGDKNYDAILPMGKVWWASTPWKIYHKWEIAAAHGEFDGWKFVKIEKTRANGVLLVYDGFKSSGVVITIHHLDIHKV